MTILGYSTADFYSSIFSLTWSFVLDSTLDGRDGGDEALGDVVNHDVEALDGMHAEKREIAGFREDHCNGFCGRLFTVTLNVSKR